MTEEVEPRRPMLAGLVSAVAHGVLLAVVFLAGFTAVDVVREAPAVALTPIQLVEPPPPALAPPALRPTAAPSPGAPGRRGREPPRSVARAPADPYAALVVHYDAPEARAPGNQAGSIGNGIGGSMFSVGDIPLPAPSRARPPRAKADYSRWDFKAARMFAGAMVRLELTIDPTGHVRSAQIVKGIDDQIDLRAIGLARRFEFYPALDDDGQPTWGRHDWEFMIR